jgi:hypothetical protein
MQTPATHVSPVAHANVVPHPPQLLGSSIVLTHALPQSVGYIARSQESPQTGGDPLQVASPCKGAVHATHVVPQDVRDVDVSLMQVPEHAWVPAGQTQVEATQTFPPVQA